MGERLPFDVAIERPPAWTHAISAAIIAGAGLVGARLLPEIATAVLLALSALTRRFGSVVAKVEVDDEEFALGSESIPRSAIDDVWLDPEQADARVTIALKDRLVVLDFTNREQAARFAGAIAIDRVPTVGHRPRASDALTSVRFVALAVALLLVKSWIGWAALALAVPGILAFVRAKQIAAGESGVEIRRWTGATLVAYDAIQSVARDKLVTRDGRTITFGRGELRDPLLGAPAWLERAREHVVARVESRLVK